MDSGGGSGSRPPLILLKPRDFEGLEVWFAESSQQEIDRLWLDGYLLSVGTEGAARNTYRGSRERLAAPAFQAYQPGEVLSSQPLGGGFSFRSLIVRPGLFEQLVAEVMGAPRPVGFAQTLAPTRESNLELGKSVGRVSECFAQPSSTLERHSALLGLTRRLLDHFAPRAPLVSRAERRAVRATLDYLLAFAERDIGFGELEAVAHLSPYHLIKVFKKAVGLTPAQFQIQARIRLAQQRLSAGQPIAQVAAEVGFADQAHLTRTFKRLLGVTPGRYVRDNTPG